MVNLGGFRFLANPFTIITLAAIMALVYFRKPVSETLGGLGMGLGTFGTGINQFISQVSSPKIQPTLGLELTGIFGQAAQWAGELVKRDTGNQNTTSTPAGTTGGYSIAQGVQESKTPSAWDIMWQKQWR